MVSEAIVKQKFAAVLKLRRKYLKLGEQVKQVRAAGNKAYKGFREDVTRVRKG